MATSRFLVCSARFLARRENLLLMRDNMESDQMHKTFCRAAYVIALLVGPALAVALLRMNQLQCNCPPLSDGEGASPTLISKAKLGSSLALPK